MTQPFDLFALQPTRIGAAMSHALSDALLELRPGDDIGLSLGEISSVELLGKLGCAQLNSSRFVRLSRVLVHWSFLDLTGFSMQPLKSLCQVANFAEELFWSCSTNQWLRTKIISDIHPKPKHLFPFGVIATQSSNSGFSSIAFHSNFVPCHPDWRNVESGRGEGAGVARKRLCFSSHVLEDVLLGDKSLVERLDELNERNAKSAVVNSPAHDGGGGNEESKPLWEIGPHEFDIVDTTIASGDKVWKISWRGGIFIMKNFKIPEVDDDDDDFETSDVIQEGPFDRELEVVRRLSHPHIVYSFGMSEDKKQKSLWMEALDFDLFSLIEERGRLTDCSEPPFSPLHTLDILLQIARAMTHMHELPEPVIHGDLKPQNIFVLSHDELEGDILGGVCQYYVKVADFGSARILRQNSFKPDRGTTRYLAPEVFLAFSQQYPIEFPKKIDVYSFGILAFQVLTGLEPYEGELMGQIREGVILGTWRPSLQEACRRPKFLYDPDLVKLVERCWHHEAPARPEFSDVTTELVRIYENLNQNLMDGAPAL